MKPGLIILTAISFLVLETPSSGATERARFRLSTVREKVCTGIGHRVESGESLARLSRQAQEFIQFRRGSLSKKKRASWLSACEESAALNIFCGYVPDGPERHPASASKTREPASSDVFTIAELLSSGKLPDSASLREGEYYRALKLFPRWQVLEPVVKEALAAKTCPNPGFLTALAQKAEEFLPSEQIKSSAIALYGRALECGDLETSVKARYRLALFHVWDGVCAQAEPHLLILSEQKGGEYASRAVYWRYHCAKAAGDKKTEGEMRDRLVTEFPLSYHALSVASSDSTLRKPAALMARTPSSREPQVAFSSQLKPDLNRLARAAEVLQKLKAPDLAREVLNSLLEPPHSALEGTERPFRIYLAVLMNRSEETIGRFRLLASAFKEDPDLITKGTLELFYPLRRFEDIRRYGAKVDPYFVAALIRQESAFNEHARSPVGALGLMQLMPDTARRMERVSRREILDAKTNIRLGVKYLRQLLDRFDFDPELALAAYNAGPEKVDDWKRRYPTSNRMLFLDLIPFKETREYVASIARNYYWYSNLYSRRPASKHSWPPVRFTGFGGTVE